MPPQPPLSVFGFSDFRQFLRESYEALHAQERKFSHRYINSKVGSSSTGWFADLLKGRQNLLGTSLVRLMEVFRLEGSAAGYFETLVHYNQAGSLEERNYHFKKLLAYKEMTAEMVGEDRFEYYSQWYYSAIRELLFFHDFKGDFAALARKLNPPIKTAQAREAIQLLERLNFISLDAQGVYRPQATTLRKDSSFKSLYAVNLLTATMELGMVALGKFPKEERHISGMTLSYSDDGFHKALQEIESLRKRLVAMMQEDKHPDKVYQVNLQLFPVTQ